MNQPAHRRALSRSLPSALLLSLACSLAAACGGAPGEVDDALDAAALASIPPQPSRSLCAVGQPGFANCHALIRTSGPEFDAATGKPSGLTPADLASAYELPAASSAVDARSAQVTIAIVDAFDAPNAESDLAAYRKQFGLAPCTSANGCFKKVGQTGKSSLPAADPDWAVEIALDLEMASAACPSCRLLLVEASSQSMSDLGAAENSAVKLGAKIISNSWGGAETNDSASYDASYFHHAGVLITASSGDSGYGVEYPASSTWVVAVGGTKLAKSAASRGWSEIVWSDAGSGCSSTEKKPSWQRDAACSMRTVADVSAVADPATGVAAYATVNGKPGWHVLGGTSVASPLIAGIFAATGLAGASPSVAYANASAFHDIRAGRNGSCPSSASYLCAAHAGYDGPSGLGSPNGLLLQHATAVSQTDVAPLE